MLKHVHTDVKQGSLTTIKWENDGHMHTSLEVWYRGMSSKTGYLWKLLWLTMLTGGPVTDMLVNSLSQSRINYQPTAFTWIVENE